MRNRSKLVASALGVVWCIGCSSSDSTTTTPAVDDGGVVDSGITPIPVADSGNPSSDSGGATAGSATVTGSISGWSITPTDSFSYFQTNAVTSTEQDVFIWITDFSNGCGLAETNATKMGGKALKVELLPIAAATPGTYVLAKKSTANGQPYAEVSVKQYDATCANIAKDDDDEVEAGSGSVTLTSITATEAVGSFSLLVNGTAVTGSFNAPMCANADTSTASVSCVQ